MGFRPTSQTFCYPHNHAVSTFHAKGVASKGGSCANICLAGRFPCISQISTTQGRPRHLSHPPPPPARKTPACMLEHLLYRPREIRATPVASLFFSCPSALFSFSRSSRLFAIVAFCDRRHASWTRHAQTIKIRPMTHP